MIISPMRVLKRMSKKLQKNYKTSGLVDKNIERLESIINNYKIDSYARIYTEDEIKGKVTKEIDSK